MSTAVFVVAYYVAPFDHSSTAVMICLLVLGLVVLVALTVLQVRAVLRSPHPALRAVEALTTTIPLFIVLFASTYYVMARLSVPSFGGHYTRTDMLYFTVTVFTTVGFGDIHADSQVARLVVTCQMVSDLLIIGIAVKALTQAVRKGRENLQRRSPPADSAEAA